MEIVIDRHNGYVLNSLDLDYYSPKPFNDELNLYQYETDDFIRDRDFYVLDIILPKYDPNILVYREYWYIDGIISYKTIKRGILYDKEMERIQSELSSSDYKVIKAYEASLIGKKINYDFSMVSAERQKLRDKINELKELIK